MEFETLLFDPETPTPDGVYPAIDPCIVDGINRARKYINDTYKDKHAADLLKALQADKVKITRWDPNFFYNEYPAIEALTGDAGLQMFYKMVKEVLEGFAIKGCSVKGVLRSLCELQASAWKHYVPTQANF